jgi:hypothetical protein
VAEPTPTKSTEARPEQRPCLSANTTVTEPTPTKETGARAEQRHCLSARQHTETKPTPTKGRGETRPTHLPIGPPSQ